jgi:citrate lyase subunit beta/citryl-CoA lyase
MLNKAAGEMEDAVIFDLEDACPVAERETGRIFARDIIPMFKSRGVDVLVRVNSLGTRATADDLSIIATQGLDGVMLPKSESGEDIVELSEMLSREEIEKQISSRINIVPLLESPKGVMNAFEIGGASDRVCALAFGAGDYMREMGEGFTISKLTPDEYYPVLMYARSAIAVAACALGVPAIDTPFFGTLTDIEGLERETSKVKLLGFKGKMITHPRHVETVNRLFSPSTEDVQFSKRIVEEYKKIDALGKGAAVVDGKMIDYAMYRMGIDLLSKAERIEGRLKMREQSGIEDLRLDTSPSLSYCDAQI